MKSRSFINLFLLSICLQLFFSCGDHEKDAVTWGLNGTDEIGGNPVTIFGDPKLISENEGEIVEFNGKDDGLLIGQNPIAEMQEFTIEVDLKPFRGGSENREQRFLHIQDPENEDRRILLELRLIDRDEWYGDWFIKTEKESLTLIDSSFTHPVEEWATMSLEYKNGTVKGFINGYLEVSGEIDYLPVDSKGKTSTGTRMDQRSWFKGAIREVRFSPKASNIN